MFRIPLSCSSNQGLFLLSGLVAFLELARAKAVGESEPRLRGDGWWDCSHWIKIMAFAGGVFSSQPHLQSLERALRPPSKESQGGFLEATGLEQVLE